MRLSWCLLRPMRRMVTSVPAQKVCTSEFFGLVRTKQGRCEYALRVQPEVKLYSEASIYLCSPQGLVWGDITVLFLIQKLIPLCISWFSCFDSVERLWFEEACDIWKEPAQCLLLRCDILNGIHPSAPLYHPLPYCILTFRCLLNPFLSSPMLTLVYFYCTQPKSLPLSPSLHHPLSHVLTLNRLVSLYFQSADTGTSTGSLKCSSFKELSEREWEEEEGKWKHNKKRG